MLKFILATLALFVVVKLFLMEYVIGTVICDKILHIYDTDEFKELSEAYLTGEIKTFEWGSKLGDYIARKLFGKFYRVYWVMCTILTIITIPWGILCNFLIMLYAWMYRRKLMN